MLLQQQLKNFDLTKSETTIYLYLLENGLSTPPQIAKSTKITRTNCYNILQSLIEKNLINEQAFKNRKAYLARSPKALIENLEKKKEKLQQLIPDLQALHTLQKNKPKIQFYNGFEEVKEIYLNSLEGETIFALGSTKHLVKLDKQFFIKYQKLVKKRNIFFKDILSYDSEKATLKLSQEIVKGSYEAVIFPEKYGDFPTDILIWNNKIAFITLSEPIFGTIITNNQLATTFKILFKFITEKLK